MTQRTPIIQCSKEFAQELANKLQFAITGHPIWYSDSLVDLVNRHCPDIYDMAKEAGFRFVPSSDAAELTHKPPRIWFDVIRNTDGGSTVSAAA